MTGIVNKTGSRSGIIGITVGIADTEGTGIKSAGESGGTKFLREDGDGSSSWQTAGVPGISSTGSASSDTVTLAGHLTVSGTTTTINSTTLTVDDKNIEMGSVASPSDTTADGGGLTLKGTTDKTILWENDTNQWNVNQKWTENVGSSAFHRPLTTTLGLG